MYESDGNVILCKCGKPAIKSMISKEACINWCSDCYPNVFSAQFVYKAPSIDKNEVKDATLGVKYAQIRVFLDDDWIIGGTRWSRTLLRLKHPIIYSKRGLKNLWRKVRYALFQKPKWILCKIWKKEG